MIDYLETLLGQVVEETLEEEDVLSVSLEGGGVGATADEGTDEVVDGADAPVVPEVPTATPSVGMNSVEGDAPSGLRYHRQHDVGNIGADSERDLTMAWSHGEGDAVSPTAGEVGAVTSPLQGAEELWSQPSQGAVETLYEQMGGKTGVVETLQRERMSHQVAVTEGGASVTNTRVVEQLVPVETGLQPTNFDRYAQRDARRYDGGFTLY